MRYNIQHVISDMCQSSGALQYKQEHFGEHFSFPPPQVTP
jgi:hypothetical protein